MLVKKELMLPMLKPISKEDKPKVIVMSVLIAGLAGTAVYQVMRGDERLPAAAELAAKNPPKTGTAVADASPASGAPGAKNSAPAGLVQPAAFGASGPDEASFTRVTGEDGKVYDLAMVGPPLGGKDPFMPFATAASVSVVPPAPVAPPVKPAIPFTPPPGLAVGRLDSLLSKAGITSTIPSSVSRGGVSIAEVMNGGGGMSNPTGFSGPPPSAASVVALPPPPPPALMVTGIVIGVPQPGVPTAASVAIIRGAGTGSGEERRFVRAGDSVGNGFVVAHVRRDSVVIKSSTKGDNRRVTLHLGEKPAALGAALPAQTAPQTTTPENTAENMGKDAPKNTDKNTNDKNTVPVPVLNRNPNTGANAAAGAMPQGEYRAN